MASATPSALATPDTTSTAATSVSADYEPRYIDVGINLTDPIFTGVYHGKKVHEDDLALVVQRAKDSGCKRLLVTGSDLQESRRALSLAKQHPGYIYATVGVHPCSAKQFESPTHQPVAASEYLAALRQLALDGAHSGHVAAFGEIGLDYDRLMLTDKTTQQTYFAMQLDVAEEVGLPLFLHSRAAAPDFAAILFPRLHRLRGGVVHSFTGSREEMREIVAAGLYVGINGCSLKTDENLAVVREVPLDRLMLETDGPWCEIRPSHASAKLLKEAAIAIELPEAKKKERFTMGAMVKGRNEPAAISLVAHVVAKVKGITVEEVCEAAWRNTVALFGLGIKEEEEQQQQQQLAPAEKSTLAAEELVQSLSSTELSDAAADGGAAASGDC